MKTKTKKQSQEHNSTEDLIRGLRVVSAHIISKPLSKDNSVLLSYVLTEAADRMSALVDLTVRQNKRIQELEASQ